MAFSKAKLFAPLTYDQAFWSKSLGHPARITILTHLLENGTTPFYEICKLIPLSSTTISQHLRTLRLNGLIEAEEKCPHTYYKLQNINCKILALKIRDMHYNFTQDNEELLE